MRPNFYFKPFNEEDLREMTTLREGELKLGQTIGCSIDEEHINYVVVGIAESIGPQANLGNSGSENAFDAFLKRFLNMQSNEFYDGSDTAIYGKIVQNCSFETIDEARKLTAELDTLVEETITTILLKGKIPIVIGGGHNNAFPIIAANFKILREEIAVLNLDPHADCRKLEGRHSGNPFSYAFANGYLDTYTVLGLHKSYNSSFLLDFLIENNFSFTFFDDYIDHPDLLVNDIQKYSALFEEYPHVGIELDMDAIQNMPSSAFSPSGITLEAARFYIKTASQNPNLRYLHIPEGAPCTTHEEKIVGKALAYIVWDFLEARNNISL